MEIVFYISSAVAILTTLMVITRFHPVHALLYLIVSFLSIGMIFLSLGAPFIAVLEVIIYAGAIMVLFIFVVMMLNLGKETREQERQWLKPKVWVGPSIFALVLLAEMVFLLTRPQSIAMQIKVVDPRQVALSLYGPYIIALELAGFLLMAGIVGAAHIGKQKKKILHRFLKDEDVQNADGISDVGYEVREGKLEPKTMDHS
jgi:NADH-quinone oxidoreductase subunit J